MKSNGGGHSEEDDDADEGFEPRQPLPTPPAKGAPGGEMEDFDEDFEEELEDEYELSEFTDVTDDDLAEDEEADVTAMGDFVDEDAEPEEEPAPEGEEGAEEEEGGKKKKGDKGKKGKK